MLKGKDLRFVFVVGLLFMAGIYSGIVRADRIKDIAQVQGVRDNQLIGYGLVVGLNGTGDGNSSPYTFQSMRSLLSRMGVNVPANVNMQSKNVAAVMISADLPAFAKPGQTLDITVSSIGDAKSLRGGSLLMSSLKGADGQMYAIAQGNVIVSGLGAEGSDGSKVTINVPSVGLIPNGATVERAVETPFGKMHDVVLNLRRPDFTTSNRVTQAINKLLGPGTAYSIDAGSINVQAPQDLAQRVAFISELENLNVDPGDPPARVIVNSRTGTVVIGQHVKVLPAAVAHGSLTVTITESKAVSQPGPLSQGQTVVTPKSDIKVEQGNNRMFKLDMGVSLDDVVRAVNEVGAAPGDLVSILEALKEAGALRAELIVI
ncbi:MAG: flagellar basal body P-ring protein FlgI [Gammaproteobacteria bacterium]|nr:flagellar basal body P-ring protein FlgI [Gammaproteobacteria bacterium]